MKSISSCFLLLATSLTTGAVSQTAPGELFDPAENFPIKSKLLLKGRHSMCMSVRGANEEKLARIDIKRCRDQDHQDFRLAEQPRPNKALRAGPPFYKIYPFHSEKCITVLLGSSDPGAEVIQYDCYNNRVQMWFTEPASEAEDEIYSIIKNRKTGLCVAVDGGEAVVGAPLLQLPCDASDDSQLWDVAFERS